MSRFGLTSGIVFSAALACAATAFSQAAAAPEPRVLKVEGVACTPPRGWEWEAPAGSTIALRAPIKVGGREDEVRAELIFQPNRFVYDAIQDLEGDAKKNPIDFKDFKVEDNQSFAGNKRVTEITYVKERGQDPVRLYQRRHFLFRRFGHLYEWREESPKDAPQASSLLTSARGALKFSKPETPAVDIQEVDFVNQRAKFKLPDDWTWQSHKETPAPKSSKVEIEQTGNTSALLFIAVTQMIFKQGRGQISIISEVFKSESTVKEFLDRNQKAWLENYNQVKDVKVDEKVPFRGEKSTRLSFTALPKEAQPDDVRLQFRIFFFKHKGHIFLWKEIYPTGKEAEVAERLEDARKGMNTY
jgi:hypothetical protein